MVVVFLGAWRSVCRFLSVRSTRLCVISFVREKVRVTRVIGRLSRMVSISSRLLICLRRVENRHGRINTLRTTFRPSELPIIDCRRLPTSRFIVVLRRTSVLLVRRPRVRKINVRRRFTIDGKYVLRTDPCRSLDLFFDRGLFPDLFLYLFLRSSSSNVRLLKVSEFRRRVRYLLTRNYRSVFVMYHMRRRLTTTIRRSQRLVRRVRTVRVKRLSVRRRRVKLMPICRHRAIGPARHTSRRLRVMFHFRWVGRNLT